MSVMDYNDRAGAVGFCVTYLGRTDAHKHPLIRTVSDIL